MTATFSFPFALALPITLPLPLIVPLPLPLAFAFPGAGLETAASLDLVCSPAGGGGMSLLSFSLPSRTSLCVGGSTEARSLPLPADCEGCDDRREGAEVEPELFDVEAEVEADPEDEELMGRAPKFNLPWN